MEKRISRLIPYVFIFFIWAVFVASFIISNKVPFPADYQVNFFSPWSSYENFWGPVKNAAMPDVIGQIYPWRNIAMNIWQSGNIPLWNPYAFSGNPLLANYQSAVFFPLNMLFLIKSFSFIDVWSFLVLLQPLLAMIFSYLFARLLKISIFGSLISSISFGFCGFITTWMSYATLGYAILLLPLGLFLIEKYLENKRTIYAVIFSLIIPTSFFSGHFQTSLYFLGALMFYLLIKFFSERKKRKSILSLLLYIFFGLLMSSIQILPSVEFYSFSLRSNMYQKMEVIPWSYLSTILSPDYFGNPVTRNDWFGHYAEWSSYPGAIPLFLAVYILVKLKFKKYFYFFFLGLLSLLIAYGSPLLDIIIHLKIPVLSTSPASRIIVLFSFCVAFLAGFGFDLLIEDIKKSDKKILIWLSVLVIVLILLFVFPSSSLFVDASKVNLARKSLLLSSGLFFSLIALFGLFKISKKKNIIYISSLLILLLVSFDLLRFALKWLPSDNKSLVFPNIPITSFYSNIKEPDRVLGNFGGENYLYYHLQAIEGYDPLHIERYAEFIGSAENGEITSSNRFFASFPKNGTYSSKIVDFLGVKYVVHKASDKKNSWTFPYWKEQDKFQEIFNDGKYGVYENKFAYPRAYIVYDYQVEQNNQKIINMFLDNSFDPKKTVILEKPINGKLALGNGTVEIIKYSANSIKIQATSSSRGILLLTDSFYPGWNVYIDNKREEISRADYAFRSVVIPEGTHMVQFKYEPQSFKYGMYLFILGILGICGFSYIMRKV